MRKTAGFTLVELLVVVAIIGFLSAAGMVVFADSQAKGRDAKRKADIDSIAKALEIHKTDIGGYQDLESEWFGSSQGLPTSDPKGYLYCISHNATGASIENASDVATWRTSSGSACPTTPSAYEAVSLTVPTDGDTIWKVCTLLESPVGVYCRYSLQ